MKGYCYIVLAIGFFMFYQQNPMYAVIVIGIFIVGYVMVKSRKSGKGISGLFHGKGIQPHNSMDDLITLMMLQQLTANSNMRHDKYEEEASMKHEREIEKVKQEALALLDD
ncbi:MAG: hypothetical protein ACW972_08875 [Promethearchaeota archaeon]|jgi:hypothetical protein